MAIKTHPRCELAIDDMWPAASVLFGTDAPSGMSAFATMRAIPGGRFGGKVNSSRLAARALAVISVLFYHVGVPGFAHLTAKGSFEVARRLRPLLITSVVSHASN